MKGFEIEQTKLNNILTNLRARIVFTLIISNALYFILSGAEYWPINILNDSPRVNLSVHTDEENILEANKPSQEWVRVDPGVTGELTTAFAPVFAGPESALVADSFVVHATYAGDHSTGSLTWAADWVENDASALPEQSGNIRGTLNGLHVADNNTGDDVYREVDLSLVISAILNVNLTTNGLSNVNDAITLEASNNGGAGYTSLEVFDQNTATGVKTYDLISILGSVSSNTRIRFRVSNTGGSSGNISYFDDITIAYTIPVRSLTVTTANDVLDGDTTSITALIGNQGADNNISLREAIIATNNSANGAAPDTIKFSIGTGSQTITVNGTSGGYPNGSGFDFIHDPVVIDATTQPGYTGTPLITLDGTSATGTSGGLILRTDNSTIKGFIVINFNDEGLEIDGSTGKGDINIIEDNWVGIDASGNAAGNGDDGILITETAVANQVRSNVVGSNTGGGIVIRNTNSDSNWIHGNIVGLTADTLATRANGNNGIHIYGDASQNLIGTNADGSNDASEGNIISGNTQSGIAVTTTSGINTFLGNSIYNNSLLGIDLGATAGVTSNDVDDGDSGQNDLLNFPVLTNVVQNGADLDVYFDLDLPAGWYRIEFFENPSGVDSSGYGEGEIFLGAKLVNVTGAAGYEQFSETLTGVTPSQIIGMTATASFDFSAGAGTSFDKTSEFGPSYLGPGTFEVTTTNDVNDGNTTSITTLMGDRGPDGEISLREAVIATNNTDNINNNPDQIHFEITDPVISGVHTITLSGSVLPGITDTVVIDGSTDADYVLGTPVIELNGNSLTGHGIDLLEDSDGSTVRGLIINRFNGAGIQLYFSDNDTIVGNWIGTGSDGLTDQGNTDFGIEVDRSGSSQIGGSSLADRNVISGNGNEGISLWEVESTLNIVQGNYIGVDKTGDARLGNDGDGIVISGGASKNTIGGNRLAGEGNVISGQLGVNADGIEIDNTNADSNKVYGNYIGTNYDGTDTIGNARHGVVLYNGVQGTEIGGIGTGQGNVISGNGDTGVVIDGNGLTTTTGNTVVGNFIGTDVTGLLDLGNIDHGIDIFSGASGNTIGGTTAAHRNIISGNNDQGIEISGANTSGNIIQGNYIGTNITGLLGIRNEGNGIRLNSSTGNIIGGTLPGAGNVISGNNNSGSSADGIYIPGGSGHIIQGNIIGLGSDGATILGNHSAGIAVSGSANNQIGGTTSGARNVISANNSGIELRNAGSTGNTVYGNYIGTDISGVLDRGNATDGIVLSGGAINDTIGGTTSAYRNIISGNDNDGIWITGSSTASHVVQGNWIGLNVSGNALGNAFHGIGIESSANNNLVGGITNGAGNTIANNSWDGITIVGATAINNSFLGNEIYNNGGLGIDLNDDDVTPNDLNDSDSGPNDYLNFVELNQVFASFGDLDYDFNADLPSGDYRIEFFNNPSGADATMHGEGEQYLGSIQINHAGTGSANYTGSFTPINRAFFRDSIAATITTCTNGSCTSFLSTSEFSENIPLTFAVETCDNGIDDDGDGLIDCADADCQVGDTDGDGVDNTCDLDDDNDGILDSNERCSSVDTDTIYAAQVIFNSGDPEVTPQFGDHTQALGAPDWDGDVVDNPEQFVSVGLDSAYLILGWGTDVYATNSGDANDDIAIIEVGVVESSFISLKPTLATKALLDNQGILTPDFNGFYQIGVAGGASASFDIDAATANAFTQGELLFDQMKITSNEATSFTTPGTAGPDIDAIEAYYSISCPERDSDGDLVPDYLDLDSDNDGLFDLDEAGHSAADANDDGIIDGIASLFGTNGFFDALETVADNGVKNYTISDSESTPDGTYDAYEIDADGDTCNDTDEEGITDGDSDGIAGTGVPTVDANGLVTSITHTDPANNIWQNPQIGPCLTEICNDGIDNDADGDTDCVDGDCDPVVTLTLPDTDDCTDNTTLALSGGSPGGGTYSGTGVSGTNFNASLAGVGVHTITYNYTDGNGCMNSATDDITVYTSPSATLNLVDSTACDNETTLTLSGGSPGGGTYSGTGVSGTNFDASIAGAGMHAITYTYTDGNGCAASAIDSIEVLAKPTVGLTLTDDEECVNSTILTLDGGTPAGGTFSGSGVSGGNFNAFIAGIGVHTITYTYTDSNGCTDSATDDITVVSLPVVSLNLMDDTDCVTETTLVLSGGAPGGGTYSGVGVSGTNFDASVAGAGVHTITYSFTDVNGCTNTDDDYIIVFALPTVSLTLPDTEDCVLNSTLALSGGSPGGGTFSGTGVSGTNFNASLAGLGVHTITYTYTDGNGCVNTATEDITVVAIPTVSLTLGMNEDCESSTTLALSGGSPAGGTYSGAGVSGTNFNATAAGAGSHIITYSYTDANGCTNSDTDNITVYAEPVISSITPVNPTTCSGSDGSITIAASGGTGTYEYRLNSGSWQASNVFSGLSSGSYNVEVRNDNGFCTISYASNPVVLTDPPNPTAEINLPGPGCVGIASNFVATNAGGGATYSWNFGAGATPPTATGIGPHAVSYSSSGSKSINLTVTLAGCVSGDSESFTINDLPTVSLTLPDTEECVSSTNLALSGGNPSGGTFSGTGVSGTNFDASVAGVGIHTITYTYTDANGCANSATDDIEVFALPSVSLTLGLDEACVSSNTLVLSGESPAGGTYSGTGVSGTNFDASVAGPGSHIINYTYTDANGCVNTATDNVAVYDFPTIDNVTTVDPTTCGGNEGSITITASGATGNFEYRLDAGSWQAGNTFTSLSAGSYNVFVRNDNGFCELAYGANPLVLSDPVPPTVTTNVTSNYLGEDITCVGESDGFAAASGSGGPGPFTYLWSNGQTGDTLRNVVAGTYMVTATASNGCQGTGTITLNDPPPLGVSTVFSHVSCYGGFDGAIDVTAIGGVGAYTYSWNDLDPEAFWPMDGHTDDITGNNHNAISISGTEAYSSDAVDGDFSFDFNGNTGIRYDDGAFMDTSITYRTVIMHIKPDNLSGIQILYDEGGWSNGIGLRLNGNRLQGSVMSGYIPRTAYEITFPNDGLWHQVGFVYDNGEFTLMLDGVLGTPFNTGFSTLTLIPGEGEYGGLGKSFFGNSFENGYSNKRNYSGLMDNVAVYHSALRPQQIVDNNTDDGDRTNLPAGDYKVYVYDLNGCVDSVTLTLTQPDSLALTANVSNLLCNGDANGSIDLTVAGGTSPYTYLWSSGPTTEDISSLTGGTYIVTVTDDNFCTVVDSFTVYEPLVLTAPVAVTSDYNGFDISCFGATDGNATVTPAGGTAPFTYLWSNGQTTSILTNVGSGSYTVTVTDDNDCTETASVTLTDPPQIMVSASVTSSYFGEDISCVGASNGSASATASSGVGSYTYLWSNGDSGMILSNVPAGTYGVTATDDNGCTASTTVTLNDPPAISITTSVTSDYNGADVTCAGDTDGSANASSSGGIGAFTYDWSNGQTGANLTGVGAGTYTVTATDAFGCTSMETVTITNPPSVSVFANITSDYNGFNLSCEMATDGTATAAGSGGVSGFTYLWSNGQTGVNLTGAGAGTYTVTATDANGCTATASVEFSEPPPLNVSVTSADPSDCGVNDGIILITASGGVGTYEYSIDGSSWQASNSFTGLAPGTYFIFVRNNVGTCVVGPIAVTINIPEAPTIDNITIINPTTGVSTDGGILVTASGSGIAIEYSIDGTSWQLSNLFSGLSVGTYTVQVRYQGFNCISSSIVSLVAGGGVVGLGSGENYCSDDISGLNFVELYYIPFQEDHILTSLSTIYPNTCGGANVVDPVQTYVSIGVVESGTIINYDHWEDGYEPNLSFPIQSTTEVWGDGNDANGKPPGYAVDYLNAADIIVLDNSVVSTTRAAVIDFDGGDKIGSRGNLAMTRLGWATGPNVFLAGALEVYPSSLWGKDYDIPVGPNTNINDLFEYTGAVIMAKEDSTTVDIDADGDNIFETSVSLDEGESHLINSGLSSGGQITSDEVIQVHLITGDICHTYESRWFTLRPTEQWSDSYFNPVATPNDGGNTHIDFVNAPTYVHLYNPNGTSITVNWETNGGFQSGVVVASGGTAWIELPDNTGTHFYSVGNEPFYAVATIDSDALANNARNDWGYALPPESSLSSQITLVGFAPGSNPTYPNTENSAPVWLTADYPTGSLSSGSITVCIDYNGDGGALLDLNGVDYDASLVLNPLDNAKIYDPDGDQTGMRLWVCDGSDAIIAGAWGQDPVNVVTEADALDLGVGLPNGIPFAASKCVDLSKDYNSNGLYDECDEVIYTLEIRNSGVLPLSTGSLSIIDTLPSDLTYLENSTVTIIDDVVTPYPDDSSPASPFPFDEGGLVYNSVLQPGDSIFFRFEAVIGDLPGAEFILNVASVSNGQKELLPEVTFPAQNPTGPILNGIPMDTTVECDAVPSVPTIGSDIYVTNNCEDMDTIPKASWTLQYVDSEDVVSGELGPNAFDNDPNTVWSTQYNGGSPAHPHEIQIDLGATYGITGFRYLPRQSASDGMIADFEFYISDDGISWGTAVETGTWSGTLSEKEEVFNLVRGRYVRLVGLSEVGGNPWTSVAELNVLHCTNLSPVLFNFTETSTQTTNGTATDDCYTITKTWDATDICSETSSYTQTITVEDTTDPVLSNIPADITVSATTIPEPPVLDCSNPGNVALGKPASQSSTNSGGVASRAVDGNTDGDFSNNSVTLTNNEAQAWWEVDLQAVYSVEEIEIWNRTDCCASSLSNYYILVSNVPFATTDLATTLLDPDVTSFFQTAMAGYPSTITIETSARYVRVQLQGTDVLNLAEVVVTPSCILATDNCDPDVEITFSEVNVPSGCSYNITRTWTATDNCGNSINQSQIINVSTPLTISASITSDYNGKDISCTSSSDGTADVTVTGGVSPFDIDWSNGQSGSSASGLSATKYYVVVTDVNGCTALDSVTLQAPADISINANITSNYNGEDVSCFGASDGSAFANATGGTGSISYFWSSGDSTQSATGLLAGSYMVTATDANGCTVTTSVTLNDPTQLTVSASVSSDFNGEDISCSGENDGEALATSSGGTGTISYVWSNSQTGNTATTLIAGSYSVTVSDDNGCTAIASVTLNDPPELVPSILSSSDPSLCEASDGAIAVSAIGGTGNFEYRLGSGGSWQASNFFGGLNAGSYDLYVRNDDGSCVAGPISETLINPIPQSCPITPAIDTFTYCSTDSSIAFTVDPSVDATGYTWNVPSGMNLVFGQGTDSIIVDMNNIADGFYSICVVTNSNCGNSPPCCVIIEIITCPEICDNGIDDDGDGLTDCDDPDCGFLSVNTTIGSCIDDPLMDRATLAVELSWSAAYSGDSINVSVYRKTEIVDIDVVSSPHTVTFNVPADGAIGDSVNVSWVSGNPCSDFALYNAPAACSNDTISCDILYLQSFHNPTDQDSWDNGWIEYLDAVNGTASITRVVTKDDAAGLGFYDILDTSMTFTVDFNDYGFIIISASTENWISTELIDTLRNLPISILNSNYAINIQLGLTMSSGIDIQDSLYIDDTNQELIYNYNTTAPFFNYQMTRANLVADGNAYLWTTSGGQTSGNNAAYLEYDRNVNLPLAGYDHGERVFFGYHMNGVYGDPSNGGALPSPVSGYFDPTRHLTGMGKIYFDQAIISASDCAKLCLTATTNPHILYYRKKSN